MLQSHHRSYGALESMKKSELGVPRRRELSIKAWVVTRRRSVGGFALTAGIVIFAANAGRILVVDAPLPSDVIVVLAGETDRRPATALCLLEQGGARRLIMDVPADARIYGTTISKLAENYVHDLPEASKVRICPIQGLSTRDEAHDVARCRAQEAGSRILIVTSDYHTRRSLSIFRHEIQGKTFSVAAARDESQFGARWWTHRHWAKNCVDEWLRLLWWSAVERWR